MQTKTHSPEAARTLLSISLTGRRCLVVGESAYADAAQRRLLGAGASVARVSRAESGADAGDRVISLGGTFDRTMLEGVFLVVVASGDSDVDRAVVAAAQASGIPVHARDAPSAGDFRLAEALPQAGLSIAPADATPEPIREDLSRRAAALLPNAYERLVAWVARHEQRVAEVVADTDRRAALWRSVLQGWPAEAVLSGQTEAADEALEQRLNDLESPGAVYLIGAGPGDPDLLTLRAVRLLQQADVVLYDRLVSPSVLELAAASARRVYVGKRRRHHSVPQETINEMLIRHAEAGRCVVRLKGGDPFIFGRGGEEIDQLMERGITFQVVPGVTAASGCAAYAGIPLTHRDHAQSCVFTTGHRRGDGSLEIDFEGLVRPAQTIVFYMGLTGLKTLAEGLIAHGMRPDMSAALVQQGTTRNQRVIAGPIDRLSELAENAGMRAPTLVIVGEVVQLRDRLAWFRPVGGGGAFWAAE